VVRSGPPKGGWWAWGRENLKAGEGEEELRDQTCGLLVDTLKKRKFKTGEKKNRFTQRRKMPTDGDTVKSSPMDRIPNENRK